jgi:hypothetical protein
MLAHFEDEHVTKIEVNIPARKFTIHGSDGATRHLECPETEQFMNVWEVVQLATEIDEELELVSCM